ncbi:hypothetical protein D3C74_210900 [compost metagenome]
MSLWSSRVTLVPQLIHRYVPFPGFSPVVDIQTPPFVLVLSTLKEGIPSYSLNLVSKGDIHMDVLQIPAEAFNGFVFRLLGILAGLLVFVWLLKSFFDHTPVMEMFEKFLYLFKGMAYTFFAILAYTINIKDGSLNFGIPTSLSLSQCFVIILALFEAISAFIGLAKEFQTRND